jgi:hypothetical protein
LQLSGCDDGKEAQQRKADLERKAEIAKCNADKANLLAQSAELRSTDPISASNLVEACMNSTSDDDFTAAWKKAQAAIRIAMLPGAKGDPAERLKLLVDVNFLDPEAIAPYKVELDRLLAQRDAQEAREAKAAARAEAARRRKEGVSIGMSKEDVLASSWGKPRKINSTTTARGTREQWVYDGGYLYFNELEVLTTIQN